MNSEGLRSRAAALQILNRVLEARLFLDDSSTGVELSPADRAFARRLVETALRHWGHLNLIKSQLLERPLPHRASEANRLILLGLAQLLFMETASHAAVSTAVELVAKSASRRVRPLKGLANAVLRRAARDKSLLLKLVEAEPLTNLPSWLQKIWVAQFGKDMAAGLARAQILPPMLDLTFRSSQTAESWLRKNGGQQLLPGSVRVEEKGAVSELPGYASGEWWVQDLAASLPVRLLGDVSGLAVADLGAAPGGKTMQLAAAGARVTAVDRSPGRLARLRENLGRSQLEAEIVEADVMDWGPDEHFDLVLLDAPCSASGTIRRHPELPWIRDGFNLESLASVQDRLLAAAWQFVRPGGRLVYCVCSLEKTECDERVTAFLSQTPGGRRWPFEAFEAAGLEDAIDTDGNLRTWPTMLDGKGGMDGFFTACFIKPGPD